MKNNYEYKDIPLTPSVAKDLIYEIFSGRSSVSRKKIIDDVVERHEKQGGSPATGNVTNVIKKALSALKKEGLAENVSSGYWKILKKADSDLEQAFTKASSEFEEAENQPSELSFQRDDLEKLRKVSKTLQDVLAKYENIP